MQEIAPGIHHWRTFHSGIRQPVSSYWIEPAGILVDPLANGDPPEGLAIQQVVLTNRHHFRSASAFGAPIRAPLKGMHEFEGSGHEVTPYRGGEELAPGVRAIEVGGICPDECALHIEHGGGAIAFADGLVRGADGPLAFVPDSLMGDDPAAVRAALRESYRALLERDFDHLLLAHGEPWVGGGKKALKDFVNEPPGAAG
jgi:hypothetical protein